MKNIDNDKIAIIVFTLIILSGFIIVLLVKMEDKKYINNDIVTNVTTNDKKIDFEEAAKEQMSEPNIGDEIAILHIKDYGDVKVKFFKDIAPKAVENFITHAKEGYYNGTTFHRVINEFMIQGGDPKGDGTGGESIWHEGFEEECSKSLMPYRGALCMASKGVGTKSLGSQFFIVQANYKENIALMMKEKGFTDDIIKQYKKYGGDLYDLYNKYTVFGQVISGMDIVDKIASVETNEIDRPIKDVIIENIEVINYEK